MVPLTISSPVKAHLIDGSTLVFEEGVTVAEGQVIGEGRKYDIILDTSVPVSAVNLNDVAAMESYQTPIQPARSAAFNVVASPILALGALFLVLLLFGGPPPLG